MKYKMYKMLPDGGWPLLPMNREPITDVETVRVALRRMSDLNIKVVVVDHNGIHRTLTTEEVRNLPSRRGKSAKAKTKRSAR